MQFQVLQFLTEQRCEFAFLKLWTGFLISSYVLGVLARFNKWKFKRTHKLCPF